MDGLVCVYSAFDTPRLRYALEVIFRHIMHTDYRLTCLREEFYSYEGPRIYYGGLPPDSRELCIPPVRLLQERHVAPQVVEVFQEHGLPAFFGLRCAGAGYSFDLFSLVFYLLSRYEEYLPGMRDRHGRFEARGSLAFRGGFLQLPLINYWVRHLAERMEDRFHGFRASLPPFRFQPTFDVDQAWAYRYKPWWQSWGGILRDLSAGDAQALSMRRKVLAGVLEDPFFTFADIEEWHRRPGANPVFFFHLGDYGRFDKNISFRHPMLRELIRRLAGAHAVGLHPSWRAAEDSARLQEEMRRFREITGEAPLRSRQHYLRLDLPHTYRQLLGAGIYEDYTMGYADMPGFRASIAGSFPWYDLKAEKTTALFIHPFALMDVSLKQYLKLGPEEGLHTALDLLRNVRKSGGEFCTLWHNSSFSEIGDWKSWRSMYVQLKEIAQNA